MEEITAYGFTPNDFEAGEYTYDQTQLERVKPLIKLFRETQSTSTELIAMEFGNPIDIELKIDDEEVSIRALGDNINVCGSGFYFSTRLAYGSWESAFIDIPQEGTNDQANI